VLEGEGKGRERGGEGEGKHCGISNFQSQEALKMSRLFKDLYSKTSIQEDLRVKA